MYQRHPLLGGDEQDLTTEQLLGDISFAFAPGGWNADSNPPGTTTYTMPGGACELTITGTYQVTKARLALLCSPADLRRLAAQDRLLVQSGTLSMSPHRSGDGAGPAEHAVAAKFVNNSIREKDRQAAFDFLEAELRRFADDPTAAPSIRIFGRRRLTAEYHDGWFILSLKP
ncbi:MAG TPA: hypothetical protein VG269_16685 [Tepidisphaeraceae bacterium]|nr:hypothetical protein [Tepidisphaeraceae bacterium]